jgi:hypothetical protein
LQAFQAEQAEKLNVAQSTAAQELAIKHDTATKVLQIETSLSDARIALLQQSLAQVGVGGKGLQTGGYGSQTPLPTRPYSGGGNTTNNNSKTVDKPVININGSGNPADVAKEVAKVFERILQ